MLVLTLLVAAPVLAAGLIVAWSSRSFKRSRKSRNKHFADPKLIAMAACVAVLLPWMGQHVIEYARMVVDGRRDAVTRTATEASDGRRMDAIGSELTQVFGSSAMAYLPPLARVGAVLAVAPPFAIGRRARARACTGRDGADDWIVARGVARTVRRIAAAWRFRTGSCR
jgi:flagellar biosynthesis protein FliQ